MTLLVLERPLHQKRQDLVKERARPKLPGLIGNLPQCLLPKWRCAVLDLEEQTHDFSFLGFRTCQSLVLIFLLQHFAKVFLVLGLHKGQLAHTWHIRRQVSDNVIGHPP